MHAGVNLIAGAVEEAGVDKDKAIFERANAALEVDAGAAFFIHQTDLDGMAREPENVFDAGKQIVRQRCFGRAVHLGFDDVDAAGTAVADPVDLLKVMHRAQRGHQGIEETFGHLIAV